MSFFDSLEDEVKYHKSTCFYGFTTFENQIKNDLAEEMLNILKTDK